MIGRFVEYEYKTRYRKFYNSKTGSTTKIISALRSKVAGLNH